MFFYIYKTISSTSTTISTLRFCIRRALKTPHRRTFSLLPSQFPCCPLERSRDIWVRCVINLTSHHSGHANRAGCAASLLVLQVPVCTRRIRTYSGHTTSTALSTPPGNYLFFFSCFNLRFSFGLSRAFFCVSLLPLSLFPLSPIKFVLS